MRFIWPTLVATAVITSLIGASAHAVETVKVRLGVPMIDLSDAVEWHAGNGGPLLVTAAPDASDIVRRIEVSPLEDGVNWAVFALANTNAEKIERLIVVPHSQMAGSRVVRITPSTGYSPDRQDSATADIFRVTLEPGAVTTLVVQLRADRLPQIYLWESEAYRASQAR